jgi:hypothetical protein
MDALPSGHLGSKIILLDNWNEFGEGHYIAPHRQYGFGYLDAVRKVFTDAPEPHCDIVPQDVGLGPYDSRFRQYEEIRELCAKRVVAEGGVKPGVVAWWTFDEAEDERVAWDYSGSGLGGVVEGATRVPGVRGRALLCNGGSVTVPAAGPRLPVDAITVECWVKTDVGGQNDKWFVNNVYYGGNSGFRLGLSGGRLCWAVPKTPWSHHLAAREPLPLGRWVHVAATYDGQVMRLYMDGKEVGALDRGGRIHSNDYSLCLGSYEKGHRAFFTGVLDEVKIYGRALTAEEIINQAQKASQ